MPPAGAGSIDGNGLHLDVATVYPMLTSLFELFQRGGPVMWPILLCSVLSIAIGLERWVTLLRIESESASFLRQIRKALQARQLAHAERLCDNHPLPVAQMVKAGLRRWGRPRGEIREAMEEAGSQEIPNLEHTVPLLGTIAHLAPLLGLLGTVMGLVRCFQTIQEKATTVNPVNPGDLAGGIWEALLTTAFGLLVAIPAYAMYNYLVHRVHRIVGHLHSSGSELLDLLAESLDSVEQISQAP